MAIFYNPIIVLYFFIASVQLLTPCFASPDKTKLSIIIANTANYDGSYFLECDPADGTVPSSTPCEACAKLDDLSALGINPFDPVPADAICTQQYGGPETAIIRGYWNNGMVDATFDRINGCEITRWKILAPILPPIGTSPTIGWGRS